MKKKDLKYYMDNGVNIVSATHLKYKTLHDFTVTLSNERDINNLKKAFETAPTDKYLYIEFRAVFDDPTKKD